MTDKEHSLSKDADSLRRIFEENKDKPVQERWKLAVNSEVHKKRQRVANSSAKILLCFAVPPLLGGWIVQVMFPEFADNFQVGTVAISAAILYLLVASIVAWRLGPTLAQKKFDAQK